MLLYILSLNAIPISSKTSTIIQQLNIQVLSIKKVIDQRTEIHLLMQIQSLLEE
jgi:hypothetical protein